ncbi:MAG: hypothetical protein IPK10_19635 [Bacteroidetes bacterium]|nr:hypothetical protein [Bacteroidota bacterium]
MRNDIAFGVRRWELRWSCIGKFSEEELHVTAVFTGDGASSEGDFHESISMWLQYDSYL